MPSKASAQKRVVVVGGGYAGIRVAYDVARLVPAEACEVVLISDDDQHIDTPALYEIATAALPHESTNSSELIVRGASADVVDLITARGVVVRRGRVRHIHVQERLVICDDQSTISFDWLVLAVGAQLATYHIPGVEEHTFNVKNMTEALRLRHHIMRTLLTAPELPAEQQRQALTFVVAGGGATGVEVITELMHLLTTVRRQRRLPLDRVRSILVEASPHILHELPAEWRHRVQRFLIDQAIEVMVGRAVTEITEGALVLSDHTRIATRTVVWCGGLRSHSLLGRAGLPTQGRGVLVEETLQVVGHPHIFAVGDCAVLAVPDVRIPGTVPVAYSQGALVARNLRHLWRGEPLEQYHYHPTGQLITLGGKRAMALFSRYGAVGFLPWLIKQLVACRYWAYYLSWPRALSLAWRKVAVQTQND
jgi:NADH dehydrogenase